MLRDVISQVVSGRDLSRRQAHAALDTIMTGGVHPAQIAGLLVALRAKGETGDELAGLAGAMRAHATRVRAPIPSHGPLIDTCGTGGDGASTFNISTASALVAAACGATVAKHGNRSVSSKCGSADVLEALGLPLDLGVEGVERCLAEAGVGFLFAPAHHPAMKHVMPTRRGLGLRTVFNLLGPLTNPAGARRQVIGVFDPSYTEVVARALRELGSEHVWVVCGEDGQGGVLDELSTCGRTVGHELKGGEVRPLSLEPEDVGLRRAPVVALAGGDAQANASTLRAIFSGEPGPRGDAVALNAGAALVVAGLAEELRDGVELAQAALGEGRAVGVLNRLLESTRRTASP